jgi:hypothetical protein
MRFTLTFDGSLPASSNSPKPKEKWKIRRALHPQLEELWRTNPVLEPMHRLGVWLPEGSYLRIEQHHSDPIQHQSDRPGERNIIAPIEVNGQKFMPLIRESMSLICELDILFLRKEDPGHLITQGGDIDGRIKTLFDGLRMPSKGEMAAAGTDPIPQPFYALLEEDTLISGFQVKTARLLTKPSADIKEVRLVVGVTIKAVHVRGYNLPLLGD